MPTFLSRPLNLRTFLILFRFFKVILKYVESVKYAFLYCSCGVRSTRNALNASHNKYYDDGVHLTFNGLIKCLEVKFFADKVEWGSLHCRVLGSHFSFWRINLVALGKSWPVEIAWTKKLSWGHSILSAAPFFNVPATLKVMKNANLIHSSSFADFFVLFSIKIYQSMQLRCFNCCKYLPTLLTFDEVIN